MRRRRGCRRRCMPTVFRKIGASATFTPSCAAVRFAAQPAIRVIGKVADAYTALRFNIAAGNYGPPGSDRRRRIERSPIVFRPAAAQPFDARCLSWRFADDMWESRDDSIDLDGQWPVGKVRIIANRAAAAAAHQAIGETDLIYRDGKWFLHATVEVPETPLSSPPTDFSAWIWESSTSRRPAAVKASGARLNRYRKRQVRLRQRLQAKKTSSARRLLKKRRRKEAALAPTSTTRSGNASWPRLNAPDAASPSKSWAESVTGCGFEAPTGHAALVGVRPTRLVLAYKAKDGRRGVRSRRSRLHVADCSACGWVDKRNRRCQASLSVAGVASLGTLTTTQQRRSPCAGSISWGEVMRPHAAPTLTAS